MGAVISSETLPAPKKRSSWPRRLGWTVAIVASILFIALNVVFYLEARAMTHYAPVDARGTRMSELKGWKWVRTILAGPTVRRQINHQTPADMGLTFETRRFPGAHGIELETWRVPGHRKGAPVVLMFPGYGASKDTLLRAAKEFAAMGCELWLVDPHGIGGSAGSETSIGYHEAEDVAAAFRQAREISLGRPLMLYGPSMGAVAILGAVHRGLVKPDALVLECPFDRFTHVIGVRVVRLGLPRFPFAEGIAFWAGVQQGFNPFTHNPAEYARSVQCPVLLLQGERDETVGVRYVREVSRSLAPGSCEFIPDGGHSFLVEYSADVWQRSVRSFVREHFPVLASSARPVKTL